MVSKFIKRGTNRENVWEHENIGQFWKGTRTPWGTLAYRAGHSKDLDQTAQHVLSLLCG